MLGYIGNIGIGFDVLMNAILGGQRYQTISCRIGESIIANGWAARIPWPKWLREHFLEAVYTTTV